MGWWVNKTAEPIPIIGGVPSIWRSTEGGNKPLPVIGQQGGKKDIPIIGFKPSSPTYSVETEEERDFGGTDEEAADWLLDRQAKYNWDITDLAITSAASGEWDTRTKQGWLDSMNIYDAMDSDASTSVPPKFLSSSSL